MPRYTKKPVSIEAVQWTGTNRTEILNFCTDGYVNYSNSKLEPELKIQTLEGLMSATVGDYIIKGVKGEFYPCKPDIFALTYDEVKI